MSQRAADMLREEIEFLGAIKVSEVEEAQREVLQVVVRLEEEGAIELSDEGGGDVIA
jgi:flagellar motor switch protein FliG